MFRSKNALYGHMRNHKKRKRENVDDDADGACEVADILIFLSNSPPKMDSDAEKVTLANQNPGFKPVDKVGEITNTRVASVSPMNDNVKAEITEKLSEEANKKRIKLESGPTFNVRRKGVYECKICGKEFGSHQGLGGHTVKHNRDKLNLGEDGEMESNKRKKKGTQSSEHKCTKCGLVFSTGQKLGGHMRAHYPGKIKPEASSSQNVVGKTEQLPIVIKDKGANGTEESVRDLSTKEGRAVEHLDGSTSENAIDEIVREQTVMDEAVEDTDRSNTTSSHSPVLYSFDLNELPDEEYLVLE